MLTNLSETRSIFSKMACYRVPVKLVTFTQSFDIFEKRTEKECKVLILSGDKSG